MSARPPESRRTHVTNRVLGIALIIMTVLPLLIFATDFTNTGVMRSARQGATARGMRGAAEELDPEARRVRIRELRAERHPTAGTMAGAVAMQLALLTVLGVVGQRVFALRL